jgi:hypothetical protein
MINTIKEVDDSKCDITSSEFYVVNTDSVRYHTYNHNSCFIVTIMYHKAQLTYLLNFTEHMLHNFNNRYMWSRWLSDAFFQD